jgi:hypothetical protein
MITGSIPTQSVVATIGKCHKTRDYDSAVRYVFVYNLMISRFGA